ncbi:thymidine kinase [Mycoplasma haemocanis str. Illinois]|uniref:Thymidine kinase n=1 Tax=Mycoplasma haemocanis (strain Illinois) TaxID=1111676 RepID=H6N8N2_MYCHN|nr:thymidine kinase [Mycoplasma haemocanis]AEW46004.2 thymidine kinase [Mycoplasma haemocanis str. Illinois]
MSYFVPQIFVICGPMKSGKSKELLIHLDKLRYSKIPYLLFKPNIDSRDQSKITSRYLEGHSEEAIDIDVNSPKDILKHIDINSISFPRYIVIDEAQFFDKSLIDLVLYLNSMGVSFIISGLDLDAQSKPFGPIPDLLSLATHVSKLTAVCEQCYSVATRSHLRTHDPEFSKNNIKIGDGDLYEVLCLKCYYAKFAVNKV